MKKKILCIYPAYKINGVKKVVKNLYYGNNDLLGDFEIKLIGSWYDQKYEYVDPSTFKIVETIGDEEGKIPSEIKETVKRKIIDVIYNFEPSLIHLNTFAIDNEVLKEIIKHKERSKAKIIYTVHSLAYQDFCTNPKNSKIFEISKEFIKEILESSEIIHSSDNKKDLLYNLCKKYARNIDLSKILNLLDITTYFIKLQNTIFKISDVIVFVSPFLQRSAYEFGYLKDIIKGKDTVIENGISMCETYEKNRELIQKISRRKRIEEGLYGKFVIGYVGRIEEQKGVKDLLYVFENLVKKEKLKNLALILCGPRDWETYNEIVVRYGDIFGDHFLLGEYVWFVKEDELPSPLTYEGEMEMAVYYDLFDITVVPSYFETFGLVPLESVSCYTPSIVRKVSNLETFVRKGIVDGFNSNDELEKLLLSHIFKEKEINIEEKREIVKKDYSVERMRNNYETLINRLYD
jgi:glycosyltransferase involved in cell wall biosynthesis